MTSQSETAFIPPAQYTELDTRGLYCPEPVMMLHAEVRRQIPQAVIRVLATDPSTQRDIPKFCRFLGHELLAQNEQGGCYEYWIQVAPA